jgi:hypothetical protein
MEDNDKRKLEYDIHRLTANRDPKHTNIVEVWPGAILRRRRCRRRRWPLGAAAEERCRLGMPGLARSRADAGPPAHAQYKTYKVVYRRYAGLFFSICIDVSDNELTTLEAVHLFVEILDHYFKNVCELDLVFNFHKVTPPAGAWQRPGARPGRQAPGARAAAAGPQPPPCQPRWAGPGALCGTRVPPASPRAGRRGACLGLAQRHLLHGTVPARWPAGAEAGTCSAPPPTRQVYLILDEFIMGGEMQETSKKVGSLQGQPVACCCCRACGPRGGRRAADSSRPCCRRAAGWQAAQGAGQGTAPGRAAASWAGRWRPGPRRAAALRPPHAPARPHLLLSPPPASLAHRPPPTAAVPRRSSSSGCTSWRRSTHRRLQGRGGCRRRSGQAIGAASSCGQGARREQQPSSSGPHQPAPCNRGGSQRRLAVGW